MKALERPQAWLTSQAATIGSSGAGIVAGESRFVTPGEYFDQMTHAREGRPPSATPINGDIRRGLLTEPIHRDILEEETGWDIIDHPQDEFIFSDRYPWAHALPDGWIEYQDNVVPLQLKCPRSINFRTLRLRGIHGHWLLGSVHSIAVCDVQTEYFSVLCAEDMEIFHFPIDRDQSLIDWLMQIEAEFHQALLNKRRPSDPEDPPHELPRAGGDMLLLDSPEAIEAAKTYKYANNLYQEAKALREEATARIKDLMAHCEVAEIDNNLRVYHRTSAGRRRLDPRLLARAGINVEDYMTTGDPYQSFRAYEVSPGACEVSL